MNSIELQQFENRKKEHIHHALNSRHQTPHLSGFDVVHLHHDALPEIDLKDVRLTTPCFGKVLSTPFFVAGMTAGHADAPLINQRLAQVCAARGWAMGVGSQRRDLDSDSGKDRWAQFRSDHPELTLFANLGIAQVIETSTRKISQILSEMRADALAIHLNALQEALQPEGTTQFAGALKRIRELTEELSIPVILKETGCGFSKETLKKISSLRLGAVDVSGTGGTHWGRIEGARSAPETLQAQAALTFENWGESTAASIQNGRQILASSVEIWGSGGIRTGLDAAKAIALGATRVGYAQPALKAALESAETLNQWMEQQEFELRIALFCTGSLSLEGLRNKEYAWSIGKI